MIPAEGGVHFPRLVVGVLLMAPGDDAFLVQERRGGRDAGAWGVPGGLVQPGETPEEAARREVLEETGLDVEPDALGAWSTITFPDGGRFLVLWFYARLNRSAVPRVTEPEKCGPDGWIWASAENFPQPLSRPLRALFQQGLNGWLTFARVIARTERRRIAERLRARADDHHGEAAAHYEADARGAYGALTAAADWIKAGAIDEGESDTFAEPSTTTETRR